MLPAVGSLTLRGVAWYCCVYGIDFGFQVLFREPRLTTRLPLQSPTARHPEPNVNHMLTFRAYTCD